MHKRGMNMSEKRQKRITLITNYKNNDNLEMAHGIANYFLMNGMTLFLPPDKPGFSVEECDGIDFSGVDIAVVLGGDGTILTAARCLNPYDTAILGINMGNMGFLSQVERQDAYYALKRLLQGDYTLQHHMLLACRVMRKGKEVADFVALNDLVFKQGLYSRTIKFELFVDEQPVTSYQADGLIASTPTGSTAYALSVGGPLVMPEMELILLTPVSPHSFFSRAMIIPATSEAKVIFRSESGSALLAGDGQVHFLLEEGDAILITAHPKKAKMAVIEPKPFFQRVQSKILRGE